MGSGGVAIAALPTVICLKVPFSDSLGGVITPFWRIQFRLRNKHNKVVPGAKFPLKCVTIGQGTYGRLNLIWISPDT